MTHFKLYETILPFLKYKNNSVYFVPKHPIKISILKDVKYINEIKLSHVKIIDNIYYLNYGIEYQLVKEEYINCIKVILKVYTNNELKQNDFDIINKNIVSHILNYSIDDIKIEKDENKNEEDDFYTEYRNQNKKKNKYEFIFNPRPISPTYLNNNITIFEFKNPNENNIENNSDSFINIERD